MKKMIALLLAAVLCMSLCACGSTKSMSREERAAAKILELLEEGDYEGAHEVIDKLEEKNDKDKDEDDAPPAEAPAATEPVVEMPAVETPAVEMPESSEPEETMAPQTLFYIYSAEELFAMGDSADLTYILGCDIDLAGQVFTVETFRGTLDGNGFAIYNASAPLIRENEGTVQGLAVLDCDIRMAEDVGAIAVENRGSILGCVVSGIVDSTAKNAYAGGIVASNKGTIESCVNVAEVRAVSYALNDLGNVIHGTWANAGGICARNNGYISRCSNAGAIHAEGSEYISAAGGIVAGNTGGEVTDCFNTGTITTDKRDCGGICGFSDKGRFINCYNIGSSVSGIVGDNRDYIIDCYYLSSVSQNGSGTALNREGERIHVFTMEELTLESTFGTFDFENVWVMTNEGPKLR